MGCSGACWRTSIWRSWRPASAAALAGKDSMQIAVAGNEERMLLLAVYDNLGKGASGAAVECMNLVTGAEKTLGLEL